MDDDDVESERLEANLNQRRLRGSRAAIRV